MVGGTAETQSLAHSQPFLPPSHLNISCPPAVSSMLLDNLAADHTSSPSPDPFPPTDPVLMSLKEGYKKSSRVVFKAPIKEKKSVVVNGIDLLENVPPRTENEVRDPRTRGGAQELGEGLETQGRDHRPLCVLITVIGLTTSTVPRCFSSGDKYCIKSTLGRPLFLTPTAVVGCWAGMEAPS